MYNSLQNSAASFTFAGMRKIALSSIVLLTLGLFSSAPVSANEPQCLGSSCEVSFEYSGEAVSWAVPNGAFNLTFEAYGAQGGRNGGLGGKVAGAIEQPPETLIIYVGGAGAQGTNAPGGFNGGGRAGGNHSDEGSGGGASDLRVGPDLSDRIIVAGGGGGTGGWSGGGGGNGGGLQGQNGVSGQGGGGGGGTQLAGGLAGSSNGGTIGTAGSFGLGGTGGSSGAAGGGGGGGGWYGGGGGGGDIDTCCMDGGGGGGGSSYTAEGVTAVQHIQGVRSGNGLVVIRYLLMPSVVEFAGVQQGKVLSFSLAFSEVVAGLEPSDFIVSDGGCVIAEITGNGQAHELLIANCPDGPMSLTLLAQSVQGGADGPAESADATVFFDAEPPVVSWVHESYSLDSDPSFLLTHSGASEFPSIEDFSVIGCASFELLQVPEGLVVSTSDCLEGDVFIELAANSFADEHENLGPVEPLQTQRQIDLTDPDVSWANSEVVFDQFGANFAVSVSFSEPVSFDGGADSLSVTPADCLATTEIDDDGIQLGFYACASGLLQLEFAANALTDSAGRTGPASASAFTVAVEIPAPEPEPVSEPINEPDPDLTPEPRLDPSPKPAPELAPKPTPEPVVEVTPDASPAPAPEPEAAPSPGTETPQRAEPQPFTAIDRPSEGALSSEVVENEQSTALADSVPPAPSAQAELTGGSDELLLAAAEPSNREFAAVSSDDTGTLSPFWLLGSAAIGTALAAGSILAWRRRGP